MNPTTMEKLARIRDVMSNYGWTLIISLVALVIGILVARVLTKLLMQALMKSKLKPALAATVGNIVNVLLYVIVIVMAAELIGAQSANLFKLLIVFTLVAVAVIILFRPYVPSLPFKVGNTVKTGDLLGKIEASTVLNTRMRTFDGKTVWIPNSKILNDYLINYHYTPSRRVHLDVRIRYNEDLMKVKQVLEALMIEDPRVLAKPRPQVYVTHLLPDCISVGGRCWVENLKYWRTRCDLLEKIKLRFDNEGIAFAFPQRDVHLYYENTSENEVLDDVDEMA